MPLTPSAPTAVSLTKAPVAVSSRMVFCELDTTRRLPLSAATSRSPKLTSKAGEPVGRTLKLAITEPSAGLTSRIWSVSSSTTKRLLRPAW